MDHSTPDSVEARTRRPSEEDRAECILVFNLATDVDDPILGFTTLWLRALARIYTDVAVITMRSGRIDLPENVSVYSLGKEAGYSEARRAIRFYRALAHVLRKHRPTGCFSHMAPIFSVLGAPVLRPLRIPIVTWYAHPSLTLTLKAAHALSNRMVTSLPGAYPYRTEKLRVIGQGIDTRLYSPSGSARGRTPLVLCAGRISPVKNHMVLLESLLALSTRPSPPFQVAIVGGLGREDDRPYLDALHRRVSEAGLADRVSFIGPCPPDELVNWYRRAWITVNLTPAGFGDKVALESMACGTPALVANTDFRPTLGDFAADLLFDLQSHRTLTHRLERLLRLQPAAIDDMGRALREQVSALHSLDSLTATIKSEISQLRHDR